MNDLQELSIMSWLNEDDKFNEIERFFNDSLQLSHLGISIELKDINFPKCYIKNIHNYHLGGIGGDYINGGIITTLVDLSIGLTGLPFIKQGKIATAQLNIDIVKPIQKGYVYAISRVLKTIGNRIFAESIIYDCKNIPCVFATGTVKTHL